MQMVKKIAILFLVVPLLILLFMPKKELYYLLEKRLSAQNIVISGEVLEENLLGLTVKHPTIYFGGAPMATADEISLWTLLAYTKANFKGLHIAEGLPTEIRIETLDATHALFAPFDISVLGQSSLGEIEGAVALQERKIQLDIAEGGRNMALAKYLKKSEKGWTYESRF